MDEVSGSAKPCLLCEHQGLEDFNSRPNALCRACGGLERHRGLVREFDELLRFGRGRSCLEVGPASEFVFGGYLRDRGWLYRSIDQSRRGNSRDPRHIGFIDDELDLTDLRGLGDGAFDLVVIQHVIEEIVDFGRALDEIARVLAPDGVALLEIPYDRGRESSVRQPPDGFGNVWRFGRDLEAELRARFGQVQPVAFEEEGYRGTILRCDKGRTAPELGDTASEVRSFWQSSVAMAEVNRRISGERDIDPLTFLKRTYCATPRERALSLGSPAGQLEIRLANLDACERIVGLLGSHDRVAAAEARVPDALLDRVSFQGDTLESWSTRGRFDLIVADNALSRLTDVDSACSRLAGLLDDGGLLYVHDFIGPARSQWTDDQLQVINRLLDLLPERLRRDVVAGDGSPRPAVGRPAPERVDDVAGPTPRARRLPETLERHLEPVLVKPYGGAVFHQFFNRIMGNFDDDPELVRSVMELDFLLTDASVLESDYLWGVYRARWG